MRFVLPVTKGMRPALVLRAGLLELKGARLVSPKALDGLGDALAALEFYAHADLFMNPTAEMADVVLPVASCFEHDALKIGFEISREAQSRVQLRQPIVPPRGEARSDTEIVFDLAGRLVRTLSSGEVLSGSHASIWDGCDDNGDLVPSGVYLARVTTTIGTATERMIVLR